MKLWEILKGIDDGDVKIGDKFYTEVPYLFDTKFIEIEVVKNADGCMLIYSNLYGDTMSRETVVLDGAIDCVYTKVINKCSQCGQVIKDNI